MPDRIGKYEIRGEIGKGGFGKVYRGFDPTVGRLVAIKVLTSSGDPSLLARFRTEATAAGNLNHKNIVTVFEFGEDHGTFFLVMEYLEGRDLQHVMPEANNLKLVDKMNIMSQVAEGLQCAHQHGIVHRDVKPANIMLLADGTVKIMDFGIARLTHANSARLTQSGYLIGTLSYMAPELLNGKEADALCDIWAFGTIYYELLSGLHPFEASDTAAAMYRIMSWEPRRIKAVFPDCPEALDNVIFRLLTKDREGRYQNLEDVLFDTAPILLELESQQAGRLVSQAQELVGQGKLEEAEPLIRRILALDPLHQEGRALRRELQTGLKKRSVQNRVQSLCEQSEKFAAERNFADAVQSLETAVGIDPANTSLAMRLKELQAARERFEVARQLLAQARADFERNNLTGAIQAASDALNAEPGNSEARSLVSEVRQRMTGRDSEKREREIRLEIDAAEEAVKNRRFEEAVVKLEPLANEPSCRGEVAGLLTYAREELALAQRAASVKSLGKEAWALLKAKDFAGALARVESGLQTYPDEEMLLKLQQAVLSERAQEERRTAVRQALEESASLDRAGQWEQAMAPLQKALRQYPDDAGLRTAFDQAKKKHEEEQQTALLSALENDLKQAHRLLDEGQADSAIQLLQQMTVSYPGEAAVTSFLERVQADEQRRSALESLLAEIRQSLQSGRPEEAVKAIARGRKQFGIEDQLLALQLEAERALARREGLEQARKALRARNWTLAEKNLQAVLAQDASDVEARSLLDDVRKEQGEQIRDRGRKEADSFLQSNRFDDAVRCLRALQDQFPEDAAIREDLRVALEGKERQSRREAYAQGRQQADALIREGKFDAAIGAIEKLLVQFPQDAALREDLKTAGEAKLQQERKSRYNNERQRAAELVRNRKFDEAIHALEALHKQFPGDAGIEEELRSARSAKGLQTERFQVNERVAKLEQYYRQGKPKMVKELAVQLLAEIEEPRARELLDWAEEALARPPSGVQPGVLPPPSKHLWAQLSIGGIQIRLVVGIAGVVVALLAGWLVLKPKPQAVQETAVQPDQVQTNQVQPTPVQPTTQPTPVQPTPVQPNSVKATPVQPTPVQPTPIQLSLDPAEVAFEWQIGSTARPDAKTVTVHVTGGQKWEAARNADWITVTPTDRSFNVAVDPTRLSQGNYTGVVIVKAGTAAPSILSVKLEVKPAPVLLTSNVPPAPRPTPAPTPQPVATPTPTPAPPPPKPLPPVDCGPNYSGKKSEDLRWTGDLKPGETLVLGRRKTVSAGGGGIVTQGLPGCEVTIDPSTLTSGMAIEELPNAQNQFSQIKLRNTTPRSIGTVTFHWSMK